MRNVNYCIIAKLYRSWINKYLSQIRYIIIILDLDLALLLFSHQNIIDFDKSRGEGMSDLRPNSLRLLRLSMNQLDTKPVTTNINFSLNVDSITQHVNMSLLRLVHQFVTMIQNIHETRLELEGVKDDMSYKTHKKQDSSSGKFHKVVFCKTVNIFPFKPNNRVKILQNTSEHILHCCK